ncbi:MAG TPA: hypothetical protein PKC43_01750 [Phycisphaerales bacterium]|nr:hypothetical protein [Phycisphaerales bacterium]HMP36149.1 hypothetical protein [Phycisphaerales bacterium]
MSASEPQSPGEAPPEPPTAPDEKSPEESDARAPDGEGEGEAQTRRDPSRFVADLSALRPRWAGRPELDAPDVELVAVRWAENEFAAGLLAMRLEEAGIPATCGPSETGALSAALAGVPARVPVLVRREDRTAAESALEAGGVDSPAAHAADALADAHPDATTSDRETDDRRPMLATAPPLAIVGWLVAVACLLIAIAAVFLTIIERT